MLIKCCSARGAQPVTVKCRRASQIRQIVKICSPWILCRCDTGARVKGVGEGHFPAHYCLLRSSLLAFFLVKVSQTQFGNTDTVTLE